MAVLTANYIRRGKLGNPRAKDAIRYMQHRPGREGERITRPLFGIDGAQGRQDAYRMIDEAPAGTHFYRMTLDPDPKTEDVKKDLDLRALTVRTIQTLSEIVEEPVYYIAAVHADHAPHRHVYLLASVKRRLNTPEITQLKAATTQACLEQRTNLDREAVQQTQGKGWEDAGLEPAWEEDVWAF
jgi:hypothetical protein